MRYPAQDKLLHYIVGVWLYIFFSTISSPALALFMTGLVGVAKELYDYLNKENHTPDIVDFLYTAFGGVTVWAWHVGILGD